MPCCLIKTLLIRPLPYFASILPWFSIVYIGRGVVSQLVRSLGESRRKKTKMASVELKSYDGRIKSDFIKQQGIDGHFSWYHNTQKTRGIPVSTFDSKSER